MPCWRFCRFGFCTSFGEEGVSLQWSRDNKAVTELFPFVIKSWEDFSATWNGTIFKQIWERSSMYHLTAVPDSNPHRKRSRISI